MAISKQGRRRLEVEGRFYVWYVGEDDDSADLILHVMAVDKRLMVRYHLNQPVEPFLTVIGREFAGLADVGGCWRRFRCPRWAASGTVGPGEVRRLIEWCSSPDQPLVEVDYAVHAIGQTGADRLGS